MKLILISSLIYSVNGKKKKKIIPAKILQVASPFPKELWCICGPPTGTPAHASSLWPSLTAPVPVSSPPLSLWMILFNDSEGSL